MKKQRHGKAGRGASSSALGRSRSSSDTPQAIPIGIAEMGTQDTGICACCGAASRVVWGQAILNGEHIASYFVHWTIGHVREYGANFDLILGPCSDEVPNQDRRSISLAYRLFEAGPSLMVIDAHGRPFCRDASAGIPLSRPEVIGTPLAPLAFAVADAIYLNDSRIRALVPGEDER